MRGATRRSIFSSCWSKHRYAARMALLHGLLAPLAKDRGIFTTSWVANEKRATASAETKFPIAPLSTKIQMGAWLRVPCRTRGFLLSSMVSLTLLMLSSTTGAPTGCDSFSSAWGSLGRGVLVGAGLGVAFSSRACVLKENLLFLTHQQRLYSRWQCLGGGGSSGDILLTCAWDGDNGNMHPHDGDALILAR